MTRLITGLEVHRYAPELNKLHLRNQQKLPAPVSPPSRRPKPGCLTAGNRATWCKSPPPSPTYTKVITLACLNMDLHLLSGCR